MQDQLKDTMTQENPLLQEQLTDRAARLRQVTNFSVMDCKKALLHSEGNFEAAKRFLATGKWRAGKLVSWDHAVLAKHTMELAVDTGLDAGECRTALMNAGGNVELAKEQLALEGRLAAPAP